MMKYFVLLASIIVACIAASNDLLNHLSVFNITLPAKLSPSYSNWRVKGYGTLTTRLFNAPLPNGDLLVGWTDESSVGHVSYLKKNGRSGYTLQKTLNINDRIVRGIAALPDGSFGVLAWVSSSTAEDTKMYVQKWTSMSNGGSPSKVFETELKNLDGDSLDNRPTDFHIGDSRMEVDSLGNFYVYYHVHSLSGHEGDTYFKVDSASGKETRKWRWGCSHSMSNLLSFHPELNDILSLCVTDCFPGTSGDFDTNSIGGLYTEDANLLQTMAGNCGGCVGGEIGMVAPVSNGGWVVIFNSHRNDVGKGTSACSSSYNQDVGIVFVSKQKTLSGTVKWLTSTSENEIDPGLARYGDSFLVGWKKGTTKYLGLMNDQGVITSGPYEATEITVNGESTSVSWGSRDDTWRTLNDGSVAWLEAPGDSKDVLRVFVMQYGDLPPPDPSSSHQDSSSPTIPSASSTVTPPDPSSAHQDSSSPITPSASSTVAPSTSSAVTPSASSGLLPSESSIVISSSSTSSDAVFSALDSSSRFSLSLCGVILIAFMSIVLSML